jgi:hypothetical protein
LLYVGFIAFHVNEGTQHEWCGLVVDSEYVDLNVLVEVVLVEVSSELIDVAIDVTQEDEWLRIRELLLLEEVLDVLGIVALLLLGDDLLQDLDLVALRSSLNVLVVDVTVGGLGGVDDGCEEHEHALIGAHGFEHLHACRDGEALVVLDCDAHQELVDLGTLDG